MQLGDWVTNGFVTTPVQLTSHAIHQIDGLRTVGEPYVSVATGEVEFEARRRLVGRFKFAAFDRGVEIEIDRRRHRRLGFFACF